MPKKHFLSVVFAGLVATSYGQTTFIKADNTNALNTAASYVTNSGVPGSADAILIDGTLTASRTANLGGSLSINALNVATSYAQRFAFGSTAGATLTIGAGGSTNGGYSYWLRSSTNVALPRAQWSVVSTNLFDLQGNFSNQIQITPFPPQILYFLQLP